VKKPEGLTFDEASHTYRHNGIKVPGVTSILSPLTNFDGVPPDVLEAASKFGRAVHLACELDDLGDLDRPTLDPALEPYLQAWERFCMDAGAQWTHVEARVFNSRLRYAGTLDRFGTLQGLNGRAFPEGPRKAVVDIKSTAQLYPAVGPQLAAYADALNQPSALRVAVQLKPDGSYTAKVYDDPSDWPTFVSLLTLRNWCAKHNITPAFKEK
jgi:hypothetical protein